MIVSFVPDIEEIGGEKLDLPFSQLSESEAVHQKFTLAGSSTDANVFPSQITTADVVVLTSNIAVTFNVNASTVDIPLDANGYYIHWGTAITALTMSEAAGSDATVKLWMWGA